MSKKYKRQSDRKAELGIVALACCDCGLVHKMGFTIDGKGILRLDYARDVRATAQLRRGRMPYFKTPQRGDKWKMIRLR